MVGRGRAWPTGSPWASTGGRGSLFGVQSLGADASTGTPPARPASARPRPRAPTRRACSVASATGTRPIPELIEATDAGTILCNDLYDRRVPPRLAFGRVALLGDAAHPMLPISARARARRSRTARRWPDALRGGRSDGRPSSLQRTSSPTAALAVTQSRRMAKVAHARNSVAVALRNALLKRASQESSLTRLAPIVDDRPENANAEAGVSSS